MNRPIEQRGEGMHPTQGTTQRCSLSDYQRVRIKEFVVSHVSLQVFFFNFFFLGVGILLM